MGSCLRALALLMMCGALGGCGPHDRSAGGGSLLELDNASPWHSATVYVDGARVGTVDADDSDRYPVTPGLRRVEVRWSNDFNSRRSLGDYNFPPGGEVRIVAVP